MGRMHLKTVKTVELAGGISTDELFSERVAGGRVRSISPPVEPVSDFSSACKRLQHDFNFPRFEVAPSAIPALQIWQPESSIRVTIILTIASLARPSGRKTPDVRN